MAIWNLDRSKERVDDVFMTLDLTYQNLRELLLSKSIRWGEFTLASGKTSDLYIDCRKTTLDVQGAWLIGRLGYAKMCEALEGQSVDSIGGMTMGADPIALAVGMASAGESHPLKVFVVRKEPKGHGAAQQIEGNFEKGHKVVVVDDVITTGGSTLKAIDVIEANGGEVVLALVLVDRQEGGREAIEKRGIKVCSLFERSSLIEG